MEEWVVLRNVMNDIEYELVKGVLEMGGIPCVAHIRGMDGYLKILTGTPFNEGIDVLVPSDRLQEAVELLKSGFENEELK